MQPSRDPGSLDHPIRPLLAAVGAMATAPRPKAWLRGTVLDQGAEGACVGHGVVQELMSTPERVKFGTANLPEDVPTDAQAMAFWLYGEAQRDDEWAGEDYSGTSVNAGMRVARRLGLIESWRWAQTRQDLTDTLRTIGPVVLAIPWHDGMYAAPGGLLKITGEQVGWHCILANAIHPRLSVAGEPASEKIRLLNSWGTSYGAYGSAWVDADALWDLIEANDGEMVVPLGRTLSGRVG